MKYLAVAFFSIFFIQHEPVFAQSLVVQLGVTPMYYNYMMQMNSIERSLREKKLRADVVTADEFSMPDSTWQRLSMFFMTNLPANYFESGTTVLDSAAQSNSRSITWTYATINGDLVKTHLELKVEFQVGDEPEAAKHPKVLKIQLRRSPAFSVQRSAQLIGKYQKAAARLSTPPLPKD